ncbi:MAG: HPr(Ser) kinase/phosphatase [Ignavibacteria bacterium]
MNYLKNLVEFHKESIEVGFFYENCHRLFGLNLVAENDGFSKKISDRSIHRPGLALAGFLELFSYNRVQIFGNTEIKFLHSLTSEKRKEVLKKFFEYDIPCIVFSNGHIPDQDFLKLAEEGKISIFNSNLPTTKVVYFLSDFLDDQFAPQVTIHGSFVDVYGIGLLFIGRSGIGKSEIALDLVERGHRLVADDIVFATRKGEGVLMGSGSKLMKHFMEIRGLGLINVEKIFGVRAIRYQKRIEVLVVLEEWDAKKEYTRTGLEPIATNILGVNIPTVILPIFPGKNVTVIAEIIALNYLLKHYGYDAAIDMKNRIEKEIKDKSERIVDYFEHDFE